MDTTNSTITGVTLGECDVGSLTYTESRIIRQLRKLRDSHDGSQRPFMLSMRITQDRVEFYAGHPAGKVDE